MFALMFLGCGRKPALEVKYFVGSRLVLDSHADEQKPEERPADADQSEIAVNEVRIPHQAGADHRRSEELRAPPVHEDSKPHQGEETRQKQPGTVHPFQPTANT